MSDSLQIGRDDWGESSRGVGWGAVYRQILSFDFWYFIILVNRFSATWYIFVP